MKGEEFLNKLYRDLNLSDEVLHTSSGAKDKDEAVHRYMERLEGTHSKAVNKHKLDLLKSFYYKKYIVKEIDIPRYRNKERIINAQKDSLDSWLNYLLDENARYPMWVKYWAFQGMLKIGTYNETTGTYQKRSKNTLAPFIEVNPEVLARCINMVVDYVEKKELTDDELSKLVESGNFQKLYTMLLKKYKSNLSDLSNNDDGIWITYHYETSKEADRKEEEGIESEYLKLYNSLQGYNTGWCTAGSIETAKDQICGVVSYEGGDFYVYYTKNENNEYKVPRIAIRMDGKDRIGEIRGISDGQNLEEGFENIVENKLYSLNLEKFQINKYLKIISNMRKLTELNKKIKNNVEFITDDLSFIYGDIECFGWGDDPRIEKILKTRNKAVDFSKLEKEELMKIIYKNIDYLKYVPTDIEGYKEIAMEVVQKSGYALECVPTNIEGYGEIALKAVRENGDVLRYVSTNIEKYGEIVLKAVQRNGLALKYVPTDIEGYKEIALKAVQKNGYALEYVPTNIKGYKEITLKAVQKYGLALKYVPTNIEEYGEIALKAVQENGDALRYVPTNIEEYGEIALKAVQKYGLALEYVPTNTEKYSEIALKAVQENGDALCYVSTNIEGYKEIVMEAVTQSSSRAFRHVPTNIEEYSEIAMEAVRKEGLLLMCIPPNIEGYKEIAMAAVRQSGVKVLRYVPTNIEGYKEIAIIAEEVSQKNTSFKRKY